MGFDKKPLLAQVDAALSTPETTRAAYQHIFKTAPEARKFFKANTEHDFIGTDAYWLKQSTALLRKLRELVDNSDNPEALAAKLAAFFERHFKVHGITFELMTAVPELVTGFVASLGVTPDAGWKEFFKLYMEAAKKHQP